MSSGDIMGSTFQGSAQALPPAGSGATPPLAGPLQDLLHQAVQLQQRLELATRHLGLQKL